MRRALCVATVAAMFMLGLLGLVPQSGTASQQAVGTGSDGVSVTYQVQKASWGPLPSPKVYKWGRQLVFTKSQTKAVITTYPAAIAYGVGGGIGWAVLSGYIGSWTGDMVDKKNRCLVLNQPWPLVPHGLWIPSRQTCTG